MKHVAGGIIIRDKKILLIKRGSYTKMFPGYWTMPGGRGEDDEIPEDTAIREVKEEIGLAFLPQRVVQQSIIEHSGELRQTYRYIGNFSGKVAIQEEEVDGYAWFTYEESIRLNIAFDYRDVIEILHSENLL